MARLESNVAPPPRAKELNQWEAHAGETFRYFSLWPRGLVQVCGFQNADGTFSEVMIHINDQIQKGVTLAGTQELVENLQAAQEDVRQLMSTPPDRHAVIRLVPGPAAETGDRHHGG